MSRLLSHYLNLHEKTGAVIKSSLSSASNEQYAKNFSAIDDFRMWFGLLSRRFEYRIYLSSIAELEFSHYSILMGQYRQAFTGLRFFLEHTLFGIFISTKELDFKKWQMNKQDLNWSQVSDCETGVFSKDFVECFVPALTDEAGSYCAIAKKVYRECSEYTHGNFHTYDLLKNAIEFQSELFVKWNDLADTIGYLIFIALSIRYLGVFDNEQKRKIESIISDELNHIAPIREIIESDL